MAGAVIGRRVPNREHRRSRKTREKTFTVMLLRQDVEILMTGNVYQVLTGAAIDLRHALDGLLTRPRLREKGGIPGVIVVAAAIAILGDHGADQSDQSVDAGQEADLSEEMIGGEHAALRVIAVTTTRLTGDQDHHADGVLTEQTGVTRRGPLDGDGRDLTPV